MTKQSKSLGISGTGLMRSLVCWSMLLLIITGCGQTKKDGKKHDTPVIVETAQAITKDVPLYVEGIGNVLAFNTVDVKSRVTGELVKRFFLAGEQLTGGQDLFTVDPAPFEAKVREIEAKLKQSKVQYEQAKREFQRFHGLYGEKAVSQEQLETKEVDMNSKLYQVELNQAELETARLNLGYCFIKSPLDGQSGDIYIDNFNIVTANQDKLVTIKQLRPIKVRFSVPGKFLDQIREYNQNSSLEVEAFVLGDEKPEIGSLTLIDNYINPKTGMIMLEGTFPNQGSRLWPGLFVEVRLKLTVTQNGVVIPQKVVNDGPEGSYAWVVNKDQTAAIRPIKVARRDGNMVLVSEGLKSGETVVADGQLMLRPGAHIVTREQLEKMKQSAGTEKTAGGGGPKKNGNGAQKP
jgi:membrane fusion protein, multidrug efflux system